MSREGVFISFELGKSKEYSYCLYNECNAATLKYFVEVVSTILVEFVTMIV